MASASPIVERILVVDDDRAAHATLERVILLIGAEPYLAASIAQAEHLIQEHGFACALIDKNLGQDNGLEFLATLRKKQPDCQALIVTAFGKIDSAVEALRLGAADYLEKPFDLDALAHRLKMLIERHRMLSERSELQAQLMQSDRLSSLGTLAAGIVHEINNPLTYVLSNLESFGEMLTALSSDLHAEGRFADLQTIVRETKHGTAQMAAVVQTIKSFARHEEHRRSRVELSAVLDGCIRMSTVLIRQRARLTREFSVVPNVFGFESQLAQVFLNLLVNASQAIPEGHASKNEICVRLTTARSGDACVEISDTGSGMGPEVLAKLFQPFFTTKPAGVGTGIGLTLCRNIITKHGGKIEVESAVRSGTLFRILLPPMAAGVAVAASAPQPVGGGRHGRVLVVDDDPEIVHSLQRLLSREHDAVGETSGPAALARLIGGERFDVILCDLMMPEMTGAQFYAELEVLDKKQAQQVFFLTAGVLSDSSGLFAERMSDRLLPKPYDIRVLRARIRELVAASPFGAT